MKNEFYDNEVKNENLNNLETDNTNIEEMDSSVFDATEDTKEDEKQETVQSSEKNNKNEYATVELVEQLIKRSSKKSGTSKILFSVLIIITIFAGSTTGVFLVGKFAYDDYFESVLASNNEAGSVNSATENALNDVNSTSLIDAYNSVVCVEIYQEPTGLAALFGGDKQYMGAGSGVIVEEKNGKTYIVTNNHVIQGADDVYITMTGTSEDIKIPAHYIGTSPEYDTAIMYVETEELISNEIEYSVIKTGDSDEVEVFDTVYVIGNAGGEGKTVTTGVVSSLSKQLETTPGNYVTAIQTDASINPGNSGGAMVNEKGELIGINFAKVVSNQIEGMGFAIPINTAMSVVDTMVERGGSGKPYIGFSGVTLNDEIKAQFEIEENGVLVISIVEGSGAELAGLMAGDIIYDIDGKKIDAMEDIAGVLKDKNPGDIVTLSIIRGDEEIKSDVILSQQVQENTGW